MAKTKKQLLLDYFRSADRIFCHNTEEEYVLGMQGENYILKSIEHVSCDKIIITDADFESAKINSEVVTIKDYHLECQKVVTITPPISLLSYDELYDIFEEIASDSDGRVYEGYSGRCMYGKKCWGVVTSDIESVESAALNRGITNSRRDSMGLDSIVYWPDIEYVRPVEDEQTESKLTI